MSHTNYITEILSNLCFTYIPAEVRTECLMFKCQVFFKVVVLKMIDNSFRHVREHWQELDRHVLVVRDN